MNIGAAEHLGEDFVRVVETEATGTAASASKPCTSSNAIPLNGQVLSKHKAVIAQDK
jgi:hypothetical protein